MVDFVEEQRSTRGHFEQPRFGRLRVREGAALVAEQLALQQLRGQGSAVDIHERGGGAGTTIVERAGEQLLSGAARAGDQDRRIGMRQHPGRALQGTPEGGARADDFLKRVCLRLETRQRRSSQCRAPALEGGPEDVAQPVLVLR